MAGKLGLDDQIQGNVAHDDADSGNPVKVGGKASTSTPSAVANNDRVDAYFDDTGHQHVKVDNEPSVNLQDGSGTDLTSTLVGADQSLDVNITQSVAIIASVSQATHDSLNGNMNIQVGDADVANGNPVPISDAGGSITVDGTVSVSEPVSVDDNGGSLTVDNSTLSVTGGGTEASALRVTLANNSTGVVSVDDNGSTLSIDDGGGSITVDGTVSVNEPVSVDDNGGSLTVDNAALSVTGGGTEASALRVTLANNSTGVLSVDDNGGSLTVDGTVAINAEKVEDAAHSSGDTGVFVLGVRNDTNAAATNSDGDYTPMAVDSGGNTKAVGNIAHDTADAGSPVKVGAKATDYQPDSASDQGQSEVAASDRVDIAANRRGEIIEGVNAKFENLNTIEDTYDNTITTNVTSSFECWNYRYACLSYELDKANAPTDLLFEVEVTLDGTNYSVLTNGPLGSLLYDDTAVDSGIEESIMFPIAANSMRVRVTATGTDVSNTFTISNAVLYLRN